MAVNYGIKIRSIGGLETDVNIQKFTYIGFLFSTQCLNLQKNEIRKKSSFSFPRITSFAKMKTPRNKFIPSAKGYFSGCGGMEIGIMQAGINVIQSLDLDVEATDCMKKNKKYFSHSVLTVDIKDRTVLDQPDSDIIVGTYPCTKYSAIADIHGARTGDDLFLHFFRHIALARPEVYVVENVPGMKKFQVVMEAMTKLPDYYVHVFCPVDALNWLPQSRKRLRAPLKTLHCSQI